MNIMRKTFPLLAVAALMTVAIAGTAQAGGDKYMKSKSAHVVQGLQEDGNFSTLVTAVKSAGLVETLQGPGTFTVFAPHDQAFAQLPQGTLDGLLQNQEQLKMVLLYHVTSGRHSLSDLARNGGVVTLHGATLPVTVNNGVYYVGNARVVSNPIHTGNGVIYTISEVQMPPTQLE